MALTSLRKCHSVLPLVSNSIQQSVKFFSSSQNVKRMPNPMAGVKGQEIKIPIPFGHMAGVWWGNRNEEPIIALHGWQDNSNTFLPVCNMVCPPLNILCLDLPGHGLSSHLPKGHFYHYMECVIYLRRVMKHLNLEKISILGHSLGSTIGYTFAAIFPERVGRVFGIDAFYPITLPNKHIMKAANKSVEKLIMEENDPKYSIPLAYTWDEAKSRILKSNLGSLTEEAAEILMERGTVSHPTQPDKIMFTRDRRIQLPSLDRLTVEQVKTMGEKITCPVMIIKAMPGLTDPYISEQDLKQIVDNVKKASSDFSFIEVPGTHHIHLNEPEKIAPYLLKFFGHNNSKL